MAGKGAPKGNHNAAKAKIWSDAIRKSVLSRKKLDALANKLVELAEEGDLQALKEVGDRLEGKVPQAVEGTGANGAILLQVTKDDSGVL
jgi:uncharacterized ferredoxin-like protein